jgi:restriction system protein
MIFNKPQDWKQLQEYVNRIFINIGYESSIKKKTITPRGNIDIDVFAVDVDSINKDKYIIECKWWNTKIPQTVIHAFTTVMSETGGNFGFIITKKGIQSEAIKYLKFTNIKAITFSEFQKLYFINWYNKHFRPTLVVLSNDLLGYTEPINSRRFKHLDQLNKIQRGSYFELLDKYENFSYFILMLRGTNDYLQFENIENLEQGAINTGIDLNFNCVTELLSELEKNCGNIIIDFNEVFGKNIFED